MRLLLFHGRQPPAKRPAAAPHGALALGPTLTRLAIYPDLRYKHHWAVGQVIDWDNRCLLHRATPYDEANEGRVIRACKVLGKVPV